MTTTLMNLLTEVAVVEAPKRATQWAEFVALLDRRHDLRDGDRDTLRRLMAQLDLTPRDAELVVQARDQHDAILNRGGAENVKARVAELEHTRAEYKTYLRGKSGALTRDMDVRLQAARRVAEGALGLARTADELAATFRGDPAVAKYWG